MIAPWLADCAMPDQILGRVFSVRQVRERAPAGDRHVGAQPQRQDDVHPDRAGRRNRDGSSCRRKIEQGIRELTIARRHLFESILPFLVRGGLLSALIASQFH